MTGSDIMDDVYNLYCRCFPDLRVKYDNFLDKLDYRNTKKISVIEDGKLAGVSLVSGNAVLLLCVDEMFRNKGHGTKLLQQSEDMIISSGHDSIILGKGSSYLFQGVPFFSDRGICRFFEKRGYSADGESVDMTMELKDFFIDRVQIPDCPENIVFRYVKDTEQEKLQLLRAVNLIDPDWCRYYENTRDFVLAAEEEGELIGAAIISRSGAPFCPEGSQTTGEIGCVGVVPKARKKGIGLRLVAIGTDELKKMGSQTAYIGYTHLEDWYASLGYKPFMRFWMGQKV